VVRQNPEDVRTRLELGVEYGNSGRLELAEAQFLAIIEMDPENAPAHNNMALIYELTGRYSQAIGELEISLTINSQQPEIQDRLSRLMEGSP
jgi:Flp pilus assembly protein TadD